MVAVALIGLFLIYMGYRVGWKGEVETIHRCHYANLLEENKALFCRGCGTGEIIVGAGCVMIPCVNLITASELGYWIGLISIGLGFFRIILTILKYNGSLFSR